MTYDHRLVGCRPEPLAAYLKALGVLRVIAQQADSGALGSWAPDGFVLTTMLDREGLTRFFLDEYRPTPVISPWNSSSGFGPEGAGELQDIEASTDARLDSYRSAIAIARAILVKAKTEGWLSDKGRIVAACRSLLPDVCLPWLDAAVVLTADGPAFPPLLGTGGNVGRFEVSRNFHNRLLEILGLHTKKAYDRAGWLEDALFDLGETAGHRGESPSQFDPGAAGGANSAPDGQAKAVLNPWDFVLLVEGVVLFAAGTARRLAIGAAGRAAAPFMADSAAIGYASASEDEPTKGELWAPLWQRPTGLAELQRILAEGRADWRSSHARSGLEFAKAAGSLGVDRGVSAFARHLFLERAGQATVAVPAGRVLVEQRPAVVPLADLDPWLDRVRRGANPPANVVAARRAVDRAAFQVAAVGSEADLLRVLVDVARLEAAVGRATRFREETKVGPVSGLRAARWMPALTSGGTTSELRLALSLASARDINDAGSTTVSLRTLLRPVRYGHNGRPEWAEMSLVEGLDQRPIAEVLADAHARRVIDLLAGQRRRGDAREQVGVPSRFDAGLTAPLSDVAALAEGRIDERLLSQLLAGCLLLDWGYVDIHLEAQFLAAAPAQLAIVGPFYAEQPVEASGPTVTAWDDVLRRTPLRPEAAWPTLLAADRPEPVLTAALRRLRIAGLDPVLPDGRWLGGSLRSGDGPRLGAALLCRLSAGARLACLRQTCPELDVLDKENAHVQP